MHPLITSSPSDVHNGSHSVLDASSKVVRLTITSHKNSSGRCNPIDYYSSSSSASASEASSPQTPTHHPLLLTTGPPDEYLPPLKPSRQDLLLRTSLMPNNFLLTSPVTTTTTTASQKAATSKEAVFNKSQHRKSWHGYETTRTPEVSRTTSTAVNNVLLNTVEVEFYQPPSSPSDAGELTRTTSVSSTISSSAYSSAAEDSPVIVQRRRSSFLKRLKTMMLRSRDVTPTPPPAWYVQLTTSFAQSSTTPTSFGNNGNTKRKPSKLGTSMACLVKEPRITEFEDGRFRYALLVEASAKPYPLEIPQQQQKQSEMAPQQQQQQSSTPCQTCRYCGGVLTLDECSSFSSADSRNCAECEPYLSSKG